MNDRVIVTESLTKYYGSVTGVEELVLEVKRGEIFGFLGPNGAGKTTTMRLLMGLLRPSRGGATVLGHDSWRDRVAVSREVGYLPGEAPLYERLTGEGTIRFIAGFARDGDEIVGNGLALAGRFDLQLDRKVEEFSRGMRQKLALVVSLMKKPQLLIMDEPSGGLDPLMQYELYDVLREYREEGATIMLSSHNLPEVERICDRVGAIREGRLIGTERIEDLRSKRLRDVEVIFAGTPPEGLGRMPGITGLAVSGSRARFKMKGEVGELVGALAGWEVLDLSISHASLEDVFMEFYARSGAGERP